MKREIIGQGTAVVLVVAIVAAIVGGVIVYLLMPVSEEEPTEPSKPYEGITLHYLTTAPMVTADLDTEFEELTGCHIEVETVAWPDLHPKLVTALSAKSSTPDLFIMPDEWTYEFGKAGWLTPIEDYYTETELTNIMPAVREMYGYDGHLIAFVQMVMPFIMFYNEDMLNRAGFEPAETWDEFESQCEAMMDAEICKYGITWPLLSGDDMSSEIFYNILLASGAKIFDEAGNPVFNDDTGVETLQFIMDTLYTSKIASPTSIEVEKMESLRPFMAGENPYNLNWQFMYPITVSEDSEIAEYSKYCLIPSEPGVEITNLIGGGGFSINPYCEYKDAAAAYGKFILGYALKNFREKSWIPQWISVCESPETLEIDPQLPTILAQINKGFARSKLELSWYAEFNEIVRTGLAPAWGGEESAKVALDSTVDTVKAKLEEYGR